MPCRTAWYSRIQRTGLWLWALGCGGAKEGYAGPGKIICLRFSAKATFSQEIARWHGWIHGERVAGKGQQDAKKQSVHRSSFLNCVIYFRSCQISFCLKMFKGSIHFQFRIVCCQVSPLFIHKLGMLRLELAIDDFVSRALADDEVRKAMESATADGYTGPALQAGRFVHSKNIWWLPKMVVTPESPNIRQF